MKFYYSYNFVINSLASKAMLFPFLGLMSMLIVGKFFPAGSSRITKLHLFHVIAVPAYNAMAVLLINLFVFTLSPSAYATLFPPPFFDFFSQSLLFSTFVAFMILDLLAFLVHFFAHKFLWPFHKTHHAPKVLTWMVTEISHPLPYILKFIIVAWLLGRLGFPFQATMIASYIRTFYIYFTHIDCNIRYRYGLQYILVSPAMHRIHHSRDEHGKNYGFLFSTWDVLCGTYKEPDVTKTFPVGIHDDPYPESYWKQMWQPFAELRPQSKRN